MKLFTCFNHVIEPVFVLDEHNKFIYTNTSFNKLYHVATDSLNRHGINQLIGLDFSNWLNKFKTNGCGEGVQNAYINQDGKLFVCEKLEEETNRIVVVEKTHEEEKLALKVNDSLAKAAAELISPSLSIDKVARVLFKSCIELTGSESGFVAFDDHSGDNVLVHYFDEKYFNDSRLSGNLLFVPRHKYFQQGFYGYEISDEQGSYKNDLELEVKVKLGSNSPTVIKNYLIQPALANGLYYGQIVIINSPNGFTEKQANLIEALANVYAMAIFRKQMEWDLLDAKDKAEESDRLKSAFLANMSHEIRTPMNAIVGFSDMLVNNNLSLEKKKVFNQMVQSSCNDLLYLINDIIDISKIEAGMLKFHPAKFNVIELFNEIYEIGKQKIEAKGKNLDLIFEEPNEGNAEIFLDRSRLKQVIFNLLGNAIKFTEKGSICFGYHFKQANRVTFYTKDTGIGISKENQELIFESFRQAENTSSRNYGGTGLGLAISKNLVDQMGGQLKVSSKINEGTEFSFSLPFNRKLKEDSKEEINKLDEIENIALENKTYS